VIAKTIFPSPAASLGSQRARCWAVPQAQITSPQMALETSSGSSRGQPCAAVSSQTMASSTRAAPPP
jgi:hypothetical protein